MKHIAIVFILFMLPCIVLAQNAIQAKDYTYLSDYLVHDTRDLYGFPIHPREGKLSASPLNANVKLNLVEFKITPSYLFVIEKVRYSSTGINSENDHKEYKLAIQQIKTNYTQSYSSYELNLMDLRNPDIQGHLKVILDDKNQISKLQFRPSPSEPERTYGLVAAPENNLNRDSKYFTHEREIIVDQVLDIWARKQAIFPYIEVINHSNEDIEKRRLYPSDKVKISFEERTEMKGKKERLQQYVLFNTLNAENKEVKTEFLVKKTKEINGKQGDAKTIEVTLETLGSEQECTLKIFRHSDKSIYALSLQNGTDIIDFKLRPKK